MAKDIYHNSVRVALEKDGWIITNDPLTLRAGKRDVFVDLAAEKILIAERKEQKIKDKKLLLKLKVSIVYL